MRSGLPLAGLAGGPSDVVDDDDELVDDELAELEELEEVLPEVLLLLLQAATDSARTLSPAAAITRFMLDIPPLLEKCRQSNRPRGRASLRTQLRSK